MNAVLLMAHGAPSDLDEVEEYVLRIRHGRPLASDLMAAIKDRYRQIGGSPLLDRTTKQAGALQSKIDRKVFIGMRHSAPYISQTVQQMIADGVDDFIAICMAPQFSTLTIGAYQRALEEAIGSHRLSYHMVRSYARHPSLIDAFLARLRQGARRHPDAFVIFTAHSLPERVIQKGDPYDFEAKETARLVAEAAGLKEWRFAYQSQGLTSEKWLGPTVESVIEEAAEIGRKEILIAPIGFVCDHVEILYDVDIMYKRAAEAREISLYRTESLNDSAEFIELLAALVKEQP